MPSKEPRPAAYFRLDLDGRESIGFFRECSGLDSETSVIEHKVVDDNGRPVVRKVAGDTKWSNITLKRGVDEDLGLWDWRQSVLDEGPDNARCDGSIQLINYDGAIIATWSFEQGWPIKYSGATLNADSNEAAVEEVQIAHENLTRM